MQNANVTIIATLTHPQAAALSQFFKRVGHHEFAQNANPAHPTELTDMKDAANIIASALADQSYTPY